MSEEMGSDTTTSTRSDPVRPARGLGRGLSALLGETDLNNHSEFGRNDGQGRDVSTREIGIDQIVRNPNQPRRRFDDAEMRLLGESIATHGILQPLLLRPLEDGSGRYEIVAGERRWRAAQLAGLHQVPALIRSFDDLGTLEVSIVENVQRENLNPMEEAQAYQQLIDRFGRTQQAISEKVGRSRVHIANTLRLLSLPDDVQDDVRAGRLSPGHARAILSADDPDQAARHIIAKQMSVREAERFVTSQSRKAPRGEKARQQDQLSQLDGDSRALAEDLSSALGLAVDLTAKSVQAGTIAIHYTTLEQLDDLCRRLTAGPRWTGQA
ncbi:MAG: hypothetical protein RL186_1104 [Pseudomonadota bacterium]